MTVIHSVLYLKHIKTMKHKTYEIVLLGMLGAIAYVGQVALSFLPNIEVVSVLFLVYTKVFRKKALFPIYVFVLLEGVFWGFGSWWIMYLYVWTVLWGITMLFSKNDLPLFWAVINGAFGLSFGAMCSVTQGVLYGIGSGFAYFISGIPYDILHCVGNFFTALFLYKPLTFLLTKAKKACK